MASDQFCRDQQLHLVHVLWFALPHVSWHPCPTPACAVGLHHGSPDGARATVHRLPTSFWKVCVDAPKHIASPTPLNGRQIPLQQLLYLPVRRSDRPFAIDDKDGGTKTVQIVREWHPLLCEQMMRTRLAEAV